MVKSYTPLNNGRPIQIKNILIGLILVIMGIVIGGFLENYLYYSHHSQFSMPVSPRLPDNGNPYPIHADKPVIYLYPEKSTKINVKLNFKGSIVASYPSYSKTNGWSVTASPNGILTNSADNQEYSYLFWEGDAYNTEFDLTSGFIVKGADTINFLQHILPQIGLSPTELNEFIVYWYPKMKDNSYNLIHFAGKEYTDIANLNITPEPNSILRIFMVYKPLEKTKSIKPQTFPQFIRKGFTVVEWGGAELQ